MVDGATLRDLRLRRGWTQAHLAAVVDIPAPVLSAYERGRREPSLHAAARIIDALGFRISFVALPDPERCARDLEQVLLLAEQLPYTPRPLAKART